VVADAGLIFYEGDANGLAEKIEILYNNPKLRAELIAKGYKRAHGKFSWQAIAEETYRAYKEVLPHQNLT
jgi:glycosyltransferase involved in cell wall biosynthesis